MSAELRQLELGSPGVRVLEGRNDFVAELDRACRERQRQGGRMAVLCIDLDRFKHINTAFGHDFGDAILRGIGLRLSAAVTDARVLAHLGGDEFALALPAPDAAAAMTAARHVRDQLAVPLRLDGGPTVRVYGSVGVALYPDHGEQGVVLLRSADLAVAHAKERRIDHCQLYAPALEEGPRERQRLLLALHNALEREQFSLVLQPKIELVQRQYAGAEVLVRWLSPTLGEVGPDRFVPIAEDAGLIQGIGEWVLSQTARGIRDGTLPGGLERRLAVNVSAAQLQHEDFVGRFQARLDQAGIAGSALEVEITESALLASVGVAAERLAALKALGVRITLDDFGTGYSAFSHLKHLPIDALKIAPEFVADISRDEAAARLLAAIIAMARSLGLRVVAEGVETEAQARFLAELGCTEGQGYLFGRPMPPAEFAEWLRSRDSA